MSLALKTRGMDELPVPGDLWYVGDPTIFCQDEDALCLYVFHETSPESLYLDDYLPVKVSTSRSINGTSVCESWPVIRGGDGTVSNITIQKESGDTVVSVPVPGRPDRTIFITDPMKDCGEGCSIITAFESSDVSPWFYSCHITTNPVANATRPVEEVSLDLRRLASTSVALRGFTDPATVDGADLQYAIYPAETFIGYPHNGSTSGMAHLLSRYAIGVVAITAESNDMVTVPGNEPTIGTKLQVEHWQLINLIFILTAAIQLLLGLANLFFAHMVVIPDSGLVDEARILRAMMKEEKLESVSCMRQRKKNKDTSQWIYRNKYTGDGVYDLYFEER